MEANVDDIANWDSYRVLTAVPAYRLVHTPSSDDGDDHTVAVAAAAADDDVRDDASVYAVVVVAAVVAFVKIQVSSQYL